MTTWTRYVYAAHLTHVVCAELEAPLVAEMATRGAALRPVPPEDFKNPEAVTAWCIDFGGPCYTDRPVEEFAWYGLSLQIACENVAPVLRLLRALPLRRFANGAAYYKLKTWHHAIVMPPLPAGVLVRHLEARALEAEYRAQAFYAAVRARQRARRAVVKPVTGPDGGNPITDAQIQELFALSGADADTAHVALHGWPEERAAARARCAKAWNARQGGS